MLVISLTIHVSLALEVLLRGPILVVSQVKMVSDPVQIGGTRSRGPEGSAPLEAVAPSGVNQVLDMFGCGANFRR